MIERLVIPVAVEGRFNPLLVKNTLDEDFTIPVGYSMLFPGEGEINATLTVEGQLNVI